MTAAVKNLVIEQKAAFEKRLTFKDKLKRPVDLTGYTARLQIRDLDGSLIVELSTENGGITLTPAHGFIVLFIATSVTSTMTFKTANYDLKLIPPNGRDKRLLQGSVTLSVGQTE